jgi:hypothetical protein
MRKTNLFNKKTTIALLAILTVVAFGCEMTLAPNLNQPEADGTGASVKVILSVTDWLGNTTKGTQKALQPLPGSGIARTVLPTQPTTGGGFEDIAFDEVLFHFTAQGALAEEGAEQEDIRTSGAAVEVALQAGNWLIEATGYIDGEGIASGQSEITVVKGSTVLEVSVAVTNPVDTGTPGTLNYTVNYPDTVSSISMTLTDMKTGTAAAGTPVDLKGAANNSGSIELSPGYYSAKITAVNYGKTITRSEVIHIYAGVNGIVSNYEYTITAADFPVNSGDNDVGVNTGSDIDQSIALVPDRALIDGKLSVAIGEKFKVSVNRECTSYEWDLNGVIGTGATVEVDTTNLEPAKYTLNFTGVIAGTP